MELIFKNNCIVTDIENVEERINRLTKDRYNRDDMVLFVNSEENTIFYFDKDLGMREETDRENSWAWIDTGYLYYNEPIFISLKKQEDLFVGFFVGTGKFLMNGMCEKNVCSKNKIRNNFYAFQKKYEKRINARIQRHIDSEAEKTEEVNQPEKDVLKNNSNLTVFPKRLTDVTQSIFESLMFPSWRSINGLDRYIKIIGRRIEQLIEMDRNEYFVRNEMGSVIVNSGLINVFGKDFLVLYRYNVKYSIYTAYKIIQGKNEFIDNGFTKEQATKTLKPIVFFDDEDMKMTADMTDFDISLSAMVHIIEERKGRFPENLKNESVDKIATQLYNALERGLKMTTRDSNYAKAIYSARTGAIAWMIPFHINRKLTEEPELVIVICKTRNFYEVKTVLPYDDETKDRITALSLYSKIW